MRLGPITRSRAKLLQQQVTSLLIEYDVCDYENFILPKSMHLCMIRVIDNTNMEVEIKRDHEEQEAGAHEERHDGGAPHNVVAPIGGS